MPSSPATIYVFFGLIASGKSTLAQAWAERHGLAYANSDVVRKELAGLAATASRKEGVDQGIYTREFSRRTYDALLARAEEAIGQGRGVILDASYQNREERDKVRKLATRLAVPVRFVLCECDDSVKKSRLALRAQDPNAVSDGRWEIYLQQKARFEAPTELATDQFVILDTDQPIEQAMTRLDTLLPGGTPQ
ncbi:MAG: AAA family ATPase [Thermodesulfobacteriota bacterium]